MSTTRRSLLALAAAALPATALAFDLRSGSNSDNPLQKPSPGGSGRLSRMSFRGEGNRQFSLSSLLVLADGGAWYADFARRVVQRDEDKLGILRDIPLVGGLFTPTLRGRDFDASRQIGLAFQLGDSLLVDLHRSGLSRRQLAERLLAADKAAPALTLPGAGKPVETVGAANQTISYFLIGGPAAVAPGRPPAALTALAAGEAAQPIGRAYAKANNLLLLVSPSILTGWS